VSTALVTQELDRYRAEIDQIVAFGGELTVTSDSEAETVTEVLGRIAKAVKAVKAARLTITRPLDQQKKAALDLEKAILSPLEPVDRTLRAGLGAYQAEQQRKARAEQERLDRERREAEEAARREAEAAAAKAREAEATEDDAAVEQAEAVADMARARELAAQAAPRQEVVPAGPARASAGTASTRMVWRATVTDETELPREYLRVDQAAINRAVRQGLREIPGVKIEEVPEVAVRT